MSWIQDEDLRLAMSYLTERQQVALMYRYEEGVTLAELGNRFQITREAARQIEANAIRRLQIIWRRLMEPAVYQMPVSFAPRVAAPTSEEMSQRRKVRDRQAAAAKAREHLLDWSEQEWERISKLRAQLAAQPARGAVLRNELIEKQ